MHSSHPVIVTGMHRSGTSFVASLLASSGVSMGSQYLAADGHNPRGYFEDTEFLNFQRALLAKASMPDDAGIPDIGWTQSEFLDRSVIEEGRFAAAALVSRAQRPGWWGWKDPRTTILLDFWDELLGEDARYVLVYREPRAVERSQRKMWNLPESQYPLPIWNFYNRHLLDFANRHRDQCVVLESRSVISDPVHAARIMRDRLGIPLPIDFAGPPERRDAAVRIIATRLVDPDHLTEPDVRDPGAGANDPAPNAKLPLEIAAMWAELEKLADLNCDRLDPIAAAVAGLRPSASIAKTGPGTVSVVIPTFNDGEYLPSALASVLCCDPTPEFVIADDGSTDPKSIAVLDELEKRGFHVLRLNHGGVSAARNAGVAATSGEYILPLDADNMIRPAYITQACKILDTDSKVGVVYGDAQRFGFRTDRWIAGPFDIDKFARNNFIDNCAVIRRAALIDVEGYDESMPIMGFEDWELWISLASAGWQFRYIPEILFDYRNRRGSMYERSKAPEIRAELAEFLVKKHSQFFVDRTATLVCDLMDASEALTSERDAAQLNLSLQQSDREALGAASEAAIHLARHDAHHAHLAAAEIYARELAVRAELESVRGELIALRASRTMRMTRPLRNYYAALRSRFPTGEDKP